MTAGPAPSADVSPGAPPAQNPGGLVPAGISVRDLLTGLLFVTLPIGRELVLNVAGFTLRPAYFPMAGLLLLNLPFVKDGARDMPAALAALCAATVSLAFSPDLFLSATYTLWAAFTIAFALTATGYLRTKSHVRFWVRLYVTTGLAWAGVTVGQWALAFVLPEVVQFWLGSLPRVEALTQEPSYLAFYLVPIVFVALGSRRFLAAAFLAAVAILTTSRTGLAGLAAGGGILLFIKRRLVLDFLRRYGGYAAAVAVVLIALPPGRQAILRLWEFIESALLLQDPTSVLPRLQTWLSAIQVFTANPIVGVGIGGYGPALQDMGLVTAANIRTVKTTNLWLELLAETGIVGFTAFTVWAVRPLRHLRRLRQFNVSAGLVAAVVASLAMFPFIQTWWRPYLWIPWILVAAWTPRSLGPPLTVRPESGTEADDRTGDSTGARMES